jgi:trk system potassium uptake protein TrkH
LPDFRPIVFLLGILLSTLAGAMCLPAATDAAGDNVDWQVFAIAAGFTAFIGGLLVFSARTRAQSIDARQAILLVTLAWTVIPAFAALPLAFSELGISYTDAFFEAASGLTTTGATILTGLDTMPLGILLWRAVLQWIGGIGIIVMGIAILPMLRVGGMQLFHLESSDRSEKALPRASVMIGAIINVYVVLSVACTLAYVGLGMSWFDAVAHAMTTVSTGGFSTYDASLGHFGSQPLAWTATFFMLAGATTFTLMIGVGRGHFRPLFKDPQTRTLLGLVAAAGGALALWQVARDSGTDWFAALTDSVFSTVSIITTTGYVTTDYQRWGSLPMVVFFLLTFVGAASGSTAGGFKLFRLIVLVRVAMVSLRRLFHPHGVFLVRYDAQTISEDVTLSVLSFGALWGASWLAIAIGLAATGLDLTTSLSGAATALANVGPGLGDIIGPTGNFQALSDTAKWLLSAGMLLGRLELLALLVLLLPSFWRG